jgi:hypothetical protein
MLAPASAPTVSSLIVSAKSAISWYQTWDGSIDPTSALQKTISAVCGLISSRVVFEPVA